MMRAVVGLALVMIAGAAVAQERLPPLRNGMDYGEARQRLIKAGFTPVPQQQRGENRCRSLSSVCDAYPETSECLNKPAGPCRAEWVSKTGRYGAYVETRGSNAASIRVIKSYIMPMNDDPYPLEQVYP